MRFVLLAGFIFIALILNKKSKPKNQNYQEKKLTQRQLEYKEYLKSEHWKITKAAALKRAGYRCQLCGYKKNLQVHHNSYKNLGHEAPEDVIVLCGRCHYKHHKK